MDSVLAIETHVIRNVFSRKEKLINENEAVNKKTYYIFTKFVKDPSIRNKVRKGFIESV